MDQSIARQIKDAIAKNDKIGVVVGKEPSLDVMGAGLALYLSLKAAGKQVSIATPQDPLVEVSSLVGIDKVKTSLDGDGGDLIVSFPYKDKEIEKVSYTLEEGFLNIIVKAGENGLNFEEKDIQYKRTGGLPNLLFIIGTSRLSDLGKLFDPQVLKDTMVINIDVKSDNQGFGDIVSVTPRLSSVSEQIGDLLQSLQLQVDADIAQNLLTGIATATNNFQKPSTSFLAFEMAAFLMKQGAVRQKQVARTEIDDDFFLQGTDKRSMQPREDFNKPVRDFKSMNFPQPRQNPNRFQQRQAQGPAQQQPQPSAFGTNQPTKQTQQVEEKENPNDAPPDWLTPKIYKGSSNV